MQWVRDEKEKLEFDVTSGTPPANSMGWVGKVTWADQTRRSSQESQSRNLRAPVAVCGIDNV